MELDSIPGKTMLQLFVKLLDGKTATLRFATPQVSAASLKHRIFDLTRIPTHRQRLLVAGSQLDDRSFVSDPDCTVHLLLRLRGGKGGFGSLLRGAATKAGQKKTNNFDACRDMSGRRLRHVNAEKRLEEWKAEEEARKLEKIAEDFIKKKAKKGKKGVGDGEAEKYVEKYREESAKCVARVEESVREAMMGGQKRKAAMAKEAESKKLKILKGKRKMDETDDMDEDSSDDDDEEEEEEEENEKSVVLNAENRPDSDKEKEGSSGSVTGVKQDGELSGGASCESGSEEEKEIVLRKSLDSGGSSAGEDAFDIENGVVQPVIGEEKIAQSATVPCSEAAVVSGTAPIQSEASCPLSSGNGVSLENEPIQSESNGSPKSNSGIQVEAVNESSNTAELEKPLNFDEFNSAVEMEVLGMERLKSELQARGLKCGGTLKERAARLFLLKSTPLDKLPKKLLAKK